VNCTTPRIIQLELQDSEVVIQSFNYDCLETTSSRNISRGTMPQGSLFLS
jgi:hypothetical protein